MYAYIYLVLIEVCCIEREVSCCTNERWTRSRKISSRIGLVSNPGRREGEGDVSTRDFWLVFDVESINLLIYTNTIEKHTSVYSMKNVGRRIADTAYGWGVAERLAPLPN